MNTILEKVRKALRVTTKEFDCEIIDIINACINDLGIAGIIEQNTTNPLIIRAIITYAKIHFGDLDQIGDYDRLKASYDEQKAQMQMATGYTDWLK